MNMYGGLVAEKQRLLQDEVQTYGVRKYNTWLSSRLSAKEDVRKAFSEPQATLPSVDWEKRYKELVGALEGYLGDVGDILDREGQYVSTKLLLIIAESA